MDIQIYHFVEGARQARGLTVIIDVFRAFSVACYVTAGGVQNLLPVGSMDTAYRLKQDNPEYILIGERGGVIQPGFDYGNSPFSIQAVDFSGRTIVHTTSAGTQGLVNAVNADEIITGSFVNAQAIIDYIRIRNPKHVSLVCMGWGALEEADEDTLFAQYVKNALEGKPNDFQDIVRYLSLESKTGKFLDMTDASAPPEDFDLCLSLNRFPFVLKAEPHGESLIRLRKLGVVEGVML
ncbi:2-phosphosulfolactate phosphatase [Paenibacillus lignilyticus]|uniref:Probable 2-phosphosulfolactate phosphatase n=1 Tax=Paenibacillus lignilyticus TaxID=1172615 RepID=A0ABS5CBP6_9BACL|nr:2-phosphosulfolactate phosphatase [Paenibacillus lignilyticus]MBP3962563.1 2-phosphosulfolactate phosphatase [Paenibacillus lignilyticus]